MKVLFVSSEVAPFAKAGGLGDVSAALPKALRARGHDVRVVLPLYARIRESGVHRTHVLDDVDTTLGPRRIRFGVESVPLPGSDVPVLLVRCPGLYERPGVYTSDPDEHLRMAFLGHAALVTCQYLGWSPDVVHVNDWPGGLVPLALRTTFAWDRLFARTRTVLTIHNIGHQGTFGAHVLPETGLQAAADRFHQDELRSGKLSYLLTGILYADALTTVSPTYAREIRTPEHGVGLDPYLRARSEVLFGILNGIDAAEWNPAHDPHLPAAYSADDLSGKAACKESLLRVSHLPHDPDVPVIGIVSRLAWQKGFDLCERVLPAVLSRRAAQLVVLGTGEPRFEGFFQRLARTFPRQVAFHRGFSEPLAHLVEAGSDLFLMPSRYEPCGLNQMYSLRYGTPPVVHRTGGLADTVRLWNARSGEGNGFVFDHFDEDGLAWALLYALDTWKSTRGPHRPEWTRLQQNGMREDHDWSRRVRSYEVVYQLVTGRRAETATEAVRG